MSTAPLARATDPETSHGAGVIAMHRAAHTRLLALMALVQAGDEGLTDFELAERTGVGQTSVGKRRLDLERDGYVEPVFWVCEPCKRWPAGVRPATALSPSGTPARVWAITAAGLEYAHSLGITG